MESLLNCQADLHCGFVVLFGCGKVLSLAHGATNSVPLRLRSRRRAGRSDSPHRPWCRSLCWPRGSCCVALDQPRRDTTSCLSVGVAPGLQKHLRRLLSNAVLYQLCDAAISCLTDALQKKEILYWDVSLHSGIADDSSNLAFDNLAARLRPDTTPKTVCRKVRKKKSATPRARLFPAEERDLPWIGKWDGVCFRNSQRQVFESMQKLNKQTVRSALYQNCEGPLVSRSSIAWFDNAPAV